MLKIDRTKALREDFFWERKVRGSTNRKSYYQKVINTKFLEVIDPPVKLPGRKIRSPKLASEGKNLVGLLSNFSASSKQKKCQTALELTRKVFLLLKLFNFKEFSELGVLPTNSRRV